MITTERVNPPTGRPGVIHAGPAGPPRPVTLRDTPNLPSSRKKIDLHAVPICATIQSHLKGHGAEVGDGVEGAPAGQTCCAGLPDRGGVSSRGRIEDPPRACVRPGHAPGLTGGKCLSPPSQCGPGGSRWREVSLCGAGRGRRVWSPTTSSPESKVSNQSHP